MSTPSALRSRSRSRSNDGGAPTPHAAPANAAPWALRYAADWAVGRSRRADGFIGTVRYAAAAGLDILGKVKAIMSEVEDLRGQLDVQLRQTESVISQNGEDIPLGLTALHTQLLSQLAQLDKVIYMTNDVHEMAVDLICLG